MQTKQLSNEQLIWCRRTARELRRIHRRYMNCIHTLMGSKGIIFLGSGETPRTNRIEEAHVYKGTFEEFLQELTEKEKELLDYITEGGDFFGKQDLYRLRRIIRVAKSKGL